MTTLRQAKTLALAVSTAAGLFLVVGCGDDTGLAKRYAVSGTVTYNGEPVEQGQINFIPAKGDDANARPANGTIEKGQYSLTTATPNDGALPGEYKVAVTSKSVDSSKVLETIAKQGGGGRQQDTAKATAKAKNLVPAKYQLGDTSGLTATVKEQSNTVNFDLKD